MGDKDDLSVTEEEDDVLFPCPCLLQNGFQVLPPLCDAVTTTHFHLREENHRQSRHSSSFALLYPSLILSNSSIILLLQLFPMMYIPLPQVQKQLIVTQPFFFPLFLTSNSS